MRGWHAETSMAAEMSLALSALLVGIAFFAGICETRLSSLSTGIGGRIQLGSPIAPSCSWYRFRMVTSVTWATVATSFCVFFSLHRSALA